MKQETTIYDIAKVLELSAATVSRALNDHPAINKKTKALVAEKASELGYRFNPFASNLRRKRTHTLGVIVPRLNSQFMSAALAGMERVASEQGYNLLITQSLESELKERTNTQTMFNSRVDGLLVSLAYDTHSLDHFDKFFKKAIPIVFFDRVFLHPNSCSVVIDNFAAGYEAARHLIAQGKKNLFHATGNLNRNVYAERFNGFAKALEDHGLPFDRREGLHINDLSEEAGETLAKSLATSGQLPDGIFIANDLCAASFIRSLKGHGFGIPDDIAVVGFNDDPVSQFIDPHLTTIRYPATSMGEHAARKIIALIDTPDKEPAGEVITLPFELVVRGSSEVRKQT